MRTQNATTLAALEDEGFVELQARLLATFNPEARIPGIAKRGEFVYNLWTDAANPRGLWRRTTLDSYQVAQPDWETVLDLDALGAEEGVP